MDHVPCSVYFNANLRVPGYDLSRPAWKTRPYRTIDPAEVKQLRKKGAAMTEIARRLGVTRQACYKALANA